MATSRPFECSVCRASFKAKMDLTTHLNKTSPSCKTTPKKREQVVKSENHSPKARSHSETLADAALLSAMEAGMERKSKQAKKSGLESSVLSSIADGDDELVNAYSRISLDPITGSRRIDAKVVNSVCQKTKTSIDRVARIVSQAQCVGICFLLDTTGSMSSYIHGVKEQIIEIVERLQTSGCGVEGLAFVGYKDWCDGVNHFEILPFTKSIPEFKSFVGSVCAKGGGDVPEDVLGGLSRAVSLTWPENSRTRIIFHLGDAPPHGKTKFHDGRHRDDYENGHPRDPPLDELFGKMRHKKLMYYFGRINGECDKMIATFERNYGEKIETLDSAEVGNIWRSVTESVMRSVSITQRTDIATVGKESQIFTIDKKEPNWAQLLRLDGTILTFELPESIQEITSFVKLQDRIKKCRVQIAPNPFSKGSVRLAYFGKVFYSSSKDDNIPTSEIVDEVVFKEIISLPKVADLDRWRYLCDLEVQTVAAKLAIEFNGRLCRTTINPNIKTKFLMTKVVRVFKEGDTAPRYLAYEQRFRGVNPTVIKYTNNVDFVHDTESLDENGRRRLEVAVAFSHFTHDVTEGYLLVCDLQGVSYVNGQGKEILLLTDPAIHCSKHLRFGKTNLSSIGIAKFFEKHVCNKYCRELRLKLPRGEAS